METNEKQKHLKFFGIPKILPFLKNVRGQILMMVILAIISSIVDVTIPQFQRYALDTFVGKGTLATIVPFLICYIAVILLASANPVLLLFQPEQCGLYPCPTHE